MDQWRPREVLFTWDLVQGEKLTSAFLLVALQNYLGSDYHLPDQFVLYLQSEDTILPPILSKEPRYINRSFENLCTAKDRFEHDLSPVFDILLP